MKKFILFSRRNTKHSFWPNLIGVIALALFSNSTSTAQCNVPNLCTENPANSFKLITSSKTFTQMVAAQELLAPSMSSTTPQFLAVCATISADFANYVFAPGSEIVFLNNMSTLEILGSSKVEFRGTNMHGCQKLWRGILIQANGQCELNNQCSVFDAVVGIDIQPNAALVSTGTTFNGNYTAISAGGSGSPNQHVVSTTLSGNAFLGFKPLVENYIPNPNFPGCFYTKPLYGVVAINVQSMTIGALSAPLNVFSDFSDTYSCSLFTPRVPTGIESFNSSLVVRGTLFKEFGNGTEGKGINFYASAGAVSSLDLTGLVKNGSPTFDNIGVGVYGLGNMTIRNCDFNRHVWGVYLTGLPAPYTVTLEQNSFHNIDEHALYADQVSPIKNLQVKFNDFVDNDTYSGGIANFPRAGINLASFTPAQQAAWIFGNNFTNETKTGTFIFDNNGVRIRNLNGALLEGNHFTDNFSSTTQGYEGVSLFNSSTKLWSNSFAGAGNFDNHPSVGIKVNESPSCWLNCNSANQTRIGAEFIGMNSDATKFQKNNFNTHQNSLLLRYDAIMGIQPNYQNKWNGSNSNVEALFEGRSPGNQSDALFVALSKFTIQQQNPSDYWPNPRLIGSTPDPNLWFIAQSSPKSVLCVATGEPSGDEELFLTGADTKVLDGTFQSVKNHPAGTWEAKLRLFRRLAENPELQPAGSAEAAWFTAAQNTTVGSLGSIYRGIFGLSDYTALEQSSLDATDASYNIAVADIKSIDNAIESSLGNPSLLSQLMTERATKSAVLATAIQNYQSLFSNIRSSRQATAQSLLAQLDVISTAEQYETDFKTVCQVLLQTYLNDGTISESGKQTLKNIAHQCRYSGGMAVLQARASLGEEWDFAAYDNCPDAVTDRNGLPANSLITGLSPNPANQSAVLYLEKEGLTGSVVMLDMNGRSIGEWTLDGNTSIQLKWGNNIPDGLYILQVIADQQPPQTMKIVVQQ